MPWFIAWKKNVYIGSKFKKDFTCDIVFILVVTSIFFREGSITLKTKSTSTYHGVNISIHPWNFLIRSFFFNGTLHSSIRSFPFLKHFLSMISKLSLKLCVKWSTCLIQNRKHLKIPALMVHPGEEMKHCSEF